MRVVNGQYGTHIVLNYLQPDARIKAYADGILAAESNGITSFGISPGSGVIALGRRYTAIDNQYGSVAIDELLFFNEALSEANIMQLVEMVE